MFKTLKVYYSFILEKKRIFWVFIVTIVISAILYNIGPYFYKLFVDTIPSLDYQKLIKLLIIYISVRVIANITDIASFTIGDKIAINASKNARTKIFKYVQDLDFAFHTSKSTGSLISIFKRGDGAFWTIYYAIHHRISDILVSFVLMAYFFVNTNKTIGLVLLISILLAITATYFLIKFNIRLRREFNEQEDKVSGRIVDNLLNYETVKLFAKERWEYNRLTTSFESWKKAFWNFSLSFRLMDIVLGVIVNTTLAIIFLIALKLSIDGIITIGDFVLIVSFLGVFLGKLWDLVFGLRDIAKNYTDIQKYFKILDFDIKVKDPKQPLSLKKVLGEIEFKNVHFSYEGRSKDAIKGISLKIRQGQSVAFVGRSGSGKTTLVRLLMRFFDVNKGEITIDGKNIKKFTKSDLRSHMGVVPQEPILFNNTISYNIGYGKTNSTLKQIKAAAKLANIDKFIESLPKKYKTIVGERGVKLSGGQKQRVAIARMILADPEIVIFDEATSQLDSESEKLIQEAFWKASKNKTTFIIAHRLSTIMRADKIIVLENGKVIEAGTHQNLLNKKEGLYKYLWKMQVEKV